MNDRRKTILISITRASAARSFLRSDFLKSVLANEDVYVVVVLIHKIHDYFRKEFDHPRIALELVTPQSQGRIRMMFAQIFNSLIYSKAEYRHLKYGSGSGRKKNHPVIFWIKHIFFTMVSKLVFLRYLARWIERAFFIDHTMATLFDKYNPDLVFCTTIYASLDISLLKEAYYRGIQSVSTPKSWDTVGRMFFRFPSDKIIVANNWMKEWIEKEQFIDPKDLYVTGLIQFDVYAQKKSYMSKADFCSMCNLDPNKPIVLYAPEGLLTGDDEKYISEFIEDGSFLKQYNLIIRPHFSNITAGQYDMFRDVTGIYLDDQHIRITHMFPGAWDPTPENADWQAEVIMASDVVLCFMSTMVLDAHMLDKPVVILYYEAKGTERHVPIELLYTYPHFEAIVREKSVSVAKSKHEALTFTEEYIQNPKCKERERRKVVKKFVEVADGTAGIRTAEVILGLLKETGIRNDH